VPRVKYAMDYGPKNSFSMSYASRNVIFPGVLITDVPYSQVEKIYLMVYDMYLSIR